ncbi:MAG: ECF-type sigma factor [Planctomycetota bacterium]
MSEPRSNEVSICLKAMRDGDPSAVSRLLPHIYADLREIAGKIHRGDAGQATLQPTALVHEAYMRLVDGQDYENRVHFLSVAALAMRQILVDYARRRRALKRGGDRSVVVLGEEVEEQTIDLVALDDALGRLEELDARQAKTVTLRFFGGLTVEETAQELGVSSRTVKADWQMARRWLHRELAEN